MFWFLIGFILFTYLINRITLNYGFIDLDYYMEINKKTCEIGEEIEVSSIVENRKLLTISFLKIKERFPKGFNFKENIYTTFIMPYQRVRRTYKLVPERRGHFSINEAILELGDFTGFKSTSMYVELEEEIVVLPKKVELEKSIVPLGALNGDTSVKRWIIDDPLMTIGIREYTGNEPERFIHWPSSVKYNRLMVKNFDFTTDNTVIIALNVETMKPTWRPVEEEMIERVISIARGIMEEFEGLKIPYGLATNGHINIPTNTKNHFYHPGLGQNHLNNFLESLGRITYRLPGFFENTLKEIEKRRGNFTTIVIITPRILDTYIGPINNLSKSVNRLVLISLEDEHLSSLNNNIIKYRGNYYD
ncbi:MAG: DUF58 domain-containing protein [Tissierellia bacterium]|nr:DUF58 domain-containing protein [Tissierellia bacterium]